MIHRVARSSTVRCVARAIALLMLTAAVCASCSGRKKPVEPTPDFPDLESTQQEVAAAVGDTLETHPEEHPELVYGVVFPPGSLSGDATVIIRSPEDDPTNPCVARLAQASSFIAIDTGAAAVTDTILVLIPYSGYVEANPPLPILFDAGGVLLDVLAPSFSSGEITAAVPPQAGRLGWVIGLYDYQDPVTFSYLDIEQGSSFDFDSDAPAVLLIHGCAGRPSVFQQGPEPTLYDFLDDAYDGRVWTWAYPSVVTPADSTGSALVRAIEAFESAHGAFPFKIDIVAHSMGGLEARYLVRNGGADVVRKVVFLGTPNGGTTRAACVWHACESPWLSAAGEWLNPSGLGVEDLLVGSAFLTDLNSPLYLNPGADIDYYMIAGDYTPDNPYAPGSDDHFISTQSVDLHNFEHESVTLHSQSEVVGLRHGELKENHGPMLSLISEALGTEDHVPPAAVTDLSCGDCTATSVALEWTAPGDDGTGGRACEYDVRYSPNPITTASSWDSATQCLGEPSPAAAGQDEVFEVEGLAPGAYYHFAVKTADESHNWSALSNDCGCSTESVLGGHITGSFQDWHLDDTAFALSMNANGVYVLTKSLPAGSHDYKAIDGDSWNGAFPGDNQSFHLTSTRDVTWYVNFGETIGVREGDEYVFHSVNPPMVCGDFMSEIGGVDWDESDETLTVMSDTDGDDVWEYESLIPAGIYSFEVVLNNSFSQSTGSHGFGSDGTNPVLFRYRMASNLTETSTQAAPMVADARLTDGCPQAMGAIEIEFTKDVSETTAETPSNYSAQTGHSVVSATLDACDRSLVRLEVTPAIVAGEDIKVVVSGVTDISGTPVSPSHDEACFRTHEVVFEVDMSAYVQEYGYPASVHIQGDTYPLTWDVCGGCEAKDDGLGDDSSAGDTVYTVTQCFSMAHDCGAGVSPVDVKYKYIADCATWEGDDYEFGHHLTLSPSVPSQRETVSWGSRP